MTFPQQPPQHDYYRQPGPPRHSAPSAYGPPAGYGLSAGYDPSAGYGPPAGYRPPHRPKRRRVWPWIVGGVVLFIVAVAWVGSSASSNSPPPDTSAAPAGVTRFTVAAPTTAAPITSAAPAPINAAPGPAKAITAREWQLIAKNPAAHTGERIIVYGKVTQFDSATGTSGFRASVDGIVHKPSYGYVDYETNTLLAGDSAQLSGVVQDDLFKAEVVVGDPLSYETTLGGQMTVPTLLITKIDVTGQAK